MLCLSGFELYSRWVPLFCTGYRTQKGAVNGLCFVVRNVYRIIFINSNVN